MLRVSVSLYTNPPSAGPEAVLNWRRIFCRLFRRHAWTAIEPVLDTVEYHRFTFRLPDGRWYRLSYERCRFCGRSRSRYLLTRNSQRVRCEELASDRHPHAPGRSASTPSGRTESGRSPSRDGCISQWCDAQQCPAWSRDEPQEADGADEQHDWHKQPSVPADLRRQSDRHEPMVKTVDGDPIIGCHQAISRERVPAQPCRNSRRLRRPSPVCPAVASKVSTTARAGFARKIEN